MKSFLVLSLSLLVIAYVANAGNLTSDQLDALKQKVTLIFNYIDADKNGFLEPSEIVDALQKSKEIVEGHTVNEIKHFTAENIEKADEDGDGKVSFDELYDAALKEASQYV